MSTARVDVTTATSERGEDVVVAAVADVDKAQEQQQLLQEQLQLIQLCFGDHEFAVVLRDTDDKSTTKDDKDAAAAAATAVTANEDGADGGGDDGVRVYDYDAAAFVRGKLASGVTLDVLQRDLDVFVRHTRAKLEQQVNTELYVAFVQVASRLVGMQAELQAIQRPVAAVAEEVREACAQLDSLHEGVAAKMHDAVEAECERGFDVQLVQLLLLYDKLAQHLQQLQQQQQQQENDDEDGGEQQQDERDDDATAAAAMARRVTSLSTATWLLQRLRSVRAALPRLPQRRDERAEAKAYVQRATQALLDALQHVVCDACARVLARDDGDTTTTTTTTATATSTQHAQRRHRQRWRRCVRRVAALYARIDAVDVLAEVLRTRVLRGYLQETLSWRTTSLARQHAEAQVRVLHDVAVVLRNKVLPLLHTLQRGVAQHHVVRSSSSEDDDDNDGETDDNNKDTHVYTSSPTLYAMADVLWPALCEALTMRLPTLHDLGTATATAFVRKHRAAHRLLALVARGCACEAEWCALRRRRDVVQWQSRWNVEVYAALRVAESEAVLTRACGALTTAQHGGDGGGAGPDADNTTTNATADNATAAAVVALYTDDEGSGSSQDGEYALRLVALLAQQLRGLFAREVCLRACAAAFLRHVVRSTAAVMTALLQRLQSELQRQRQQQHQSTTMTATSAVGGNSVRGSSSSSGGDVSATRSEAVARVAASTAAATDGDDGDDAMAAAVRYLIALLHDADVFAAALTTTLRDAVLQCVGTCDDDDDDDAERRCSSNKSSNNNTTDDVDVDAVLTFVRDVVCAQAVQRAHDMARDHLVDASVALLHGVRSVRSAYSHTRKGLPSTPSWYVAAAAAPLTRFAHLAAAQQQQQQQQHHRCNNTDTCTTTTASLHSLLQAVVDAVVTQFVALAHDTLLAAKRTEESWEKLRKRKDNNNNSNAVATTTTTAVAAAAGEGVGSSDTSSPVRSDGGMRVTADTATDRDKMVLQLHMDAQALLRLLRDGAAGVAPSEAVAQRLTLLLRRAEWLQGAPIAEPHDADEAMA